MPENIQNEVLKSTSTKSTKSTKSKGGKSKNKDGNEKSKKTKEKEKEKDKYKVILDEENPKIKHIIEKYKVKDVFKNYSKITDNTIITTLIFKYKILEYKCHSKGCCVGTLWNNKPIKLHLVRENNKNNDLRKENLKFYCLNCYSQMTEPEALFSKIKNENIISCLKCNYNLNKAPFYNQNIKLCRYCIMKDSKKVDNTTRDLSLWLTDTNLTKEDLNKYSQDKNESKELIDEASMLILEDEIRMSLTGNCNSRNESKSTKNVYNNNNKNNKKNRNISYNFENEKPNKREIDIKLNEIDISGLNFELNMNDSDTD